MIDTSINKSEILYNNTYRFGNLYAALYFLTLILISHYHITTWSNIIRFDTHPIKIAFWFIKIWDFQNQEFY